MMIFCDGSFFFFGSDMAGSLFHQRLWVPSAQRILRRGVRQRAQQMPHAVSTETCAASR
jgi:hypothetical protein